MPEPYQSSSSASSPEERSLLEEHIARNASRDTAPGTPAASTSADADAGATTAAIPTRDTSGSPHLYANSGQHSSRAHLMHTQSLAARPPSAHRQQPPQTLATLGAGYGAQGPTARKDAHGPAQPGHVSGSEQAHPAGIAIPRTDSHSHSHSHGHGHQHRRHTAPHRHPSRSASPYMRIDDRPPPERYYSHQQALPLHHQDRPHSQHGQNYHHPHHAYMQHPHSAYTSQQPGPAPPSGLHP
ncbi:hypothetical protein IWW51_004681, partial [Coemansia sp. RSA 2702]